MKRVLSVGQCVPDNSALRRTIDEHFQAEFATADLLDDAIVQLAEKPTDLVLINRKLDADYSDGLEILKAIRADNRFANVPVMVVTNYEEHQNAAVALGAQRGFGKLSLEAPETIANLRRYLG